MKSITEVIQHYQDGIDGTLKAHGIQNIREISNVRTRTQCEMASDFISTLKRFAKRAHWLSFVSVLVGLILGVLLVAVTLFLMTV